MGAVAFLTVAFGKDARNAFANAVHEGKHEHGHRGDTGTIAEKRDFFTVAVPPRVDPCKYAAWALHQEYEPYAVDTWNKTPAQVAREKGRAEREWKARLREQKVPERLWPELAKLHRAVDDKWGPAGCIEVTGSHATKIRKQSGLAGTRQKVFLFFGWASE